MDRYNKHLVFNFYHTTYTAVISTALKVAHLPSTPIPYVSLADCAWTRISRENGVFLCSILSNAWLSTTQQLKCILRSQSILWPLTMADDNRQRFCHAHTHATVDMHRVMERADTIHTLLADMDITLLCEWPSLHYEMQQTRFHNICIVIYDYCWCICMQRFQY